MKLRLALMAILVLSGGASAAGTPQAPANKAAGAAYRLEFLIRGSAVSRLLLVFPLRVYYEAAAAVDLAAQPQPDGSVRFSYAGLPRTAYVMRTLGFSGRTLALLTVDGGDGAQDAAALLAAWQKQAPEFSERIKRVKKFPHRLLTTAPEPFAFSRSASGHYRDIAVGLEPRYRYDPARHGIYFNVFPMLAELLRLLNHRYAPNERNAVAGPLPTEWSGDEIDFSAGLNRTAGLMEKVVKSLVTVEQKFPFRLLFHVAAQDAGAIEIRGESFPDVPLWKGFMIREVTRRVRLRPDGREVFADEIHVDIRNSKGQGGFGRLRLMKINPQEDAR